jgi:hypothetical protein
MFSDECHTAWQNLRQSPIFGCICLTGMPNKKRCDQIFDIVNGNPCIGKYSSRGILKKTRPLCLSLSLPHFLS